MLPQAATISQLGPTGWERSLDIGLLVKILLALLPYQSLGYQHPFLLYQ
jgi:hypothetical protein